MKLLVITQTIDTQDTTLGFFHRWVEEFSKRFERVSVVCLKQGDTRLPQTVSVYSLGKEYSNQSTDFFSVLMKKIVYSVRFYKVLWKLRSSYDVVFVHMNQEYVLLAGLYWKLTGKRIFLWRNHPHGDVFTQVALLLSDTVFYTSSHSFTAQNYKARNMPAGIDTSVFTKNSLISRKKNSLLMFGRIAPIKKIEKAIDVVALLKTKGKIVQLSIVGDVLPKYKGYMETLKDRVEASGIQDLVTFSKGVPFEQAPHLFQSHEIFLNFTPSGSFDKMVIEALACGSKVLVSNESMKDILPQFSYAPGDTEDIARKIERLLELPSDQANEYAEESQVVVQKQSLPVLMDTLLDIIAFHG